MMNSMKIKNLKSMQEFRDSEILPRNGSKILGTFCDVDVTHFCDILLDVLFGPSKDQQNEVFF